MCLKYICIYIYEYRHTYIYHRVAAVDFPLSAYGEGGEKMENKFV